MVVHAVPVKSISGLTMNGIHKSYDYNDDEAFTEALDEIWLKLKWDNLDKFLL